MNLAWRALFFGLCVNLGVYMVCAILGVSPTLAQVGSGQLADAYDATEVVDTWKWSDTGSLVGDIGSALRFFWDKNVPLIEGIIILAKNLGCPNAVLDPIKAVWRFVWFTFIIDMIWGRRIMYD